MQNHTKTYVEEDKHLHWYADDQISVFYGNTFNAQYEFDGSDGDTSGSFTAISDKLVTGEKLNTIYAVYPYNAANSISTSGTMQILIPSVQDYSQNSFGNNANPMVAVTESINDKYLPFKNVCGYLKLKLYGSNVKVKYVLVNSNSEGWENSLHTGSLPVRMENDEPIIVWDEVSCATVGVRMDCGDDGVILGTTAKNATEFWFAIPPRTFNEGINIQVMTTDGKTFEKSTNNSVTITRNDIQPMAALEVTPTIPNNQIWYKTKDSKNITPYSSELSNMIENNVYDSEKGVFVMIFNKNLTEIPANSFYTNSNLTSIILPNSVTSIGTSAFSNCSNLTDVALPEAIESIGQEAFRSCNALTSIKLPNSLKSIGYMAFNSCTALETISISANITEWGSFIFEYCTNLKNITLPNGITTIPSGLLSGCKSITSFTIPQSVTTIGYNAFYNTGLTTISIPSGVTDIGDYAFKSSTLKTIRFSSSTPATLGYYVFQAQDGLKIIVPSSSIGSYKSKWSDWKDYITY